MCIQSHDSTTFSPEFRLSGPVVLPRHVHISSCRTRTVVGRLRMCSYGPRSLCLLSWRFAVADGHRFPAAYVIFNRKYWIKVALIFILFIEVISIPLVLVYLIPRVKFDTTCLVNLDAAQLVLFVSVLQPIYFIVLLLFS